MQTILLVMPAWLSKYPCTESGLFGAGASLKEEKGKEGSGCVLVCFLMPHAQKCVSS